MAACSSKGFTLALGQANADGRISFQEIQTGVNKHLPPGQRLEDLDSMPEQQWAAMMGMVTPDAMLHLLECGMTVMCGRCPWWTWRSR